MTEPDKVGLQELELIRKDMLRLARVVESTVQRMKALELWQTTMDMTLSLTSEDN